jgi:hypothetical protein
METKFNKQLEILKALQAQFLAIKIENAVRVQEAVTKKA